MHEVNDRSRDIGEFVPAPDDDMLICRCEEITKGEIRKAVHEGMWTMTEIRRYLRDNNPVRISRSIKDTAYKVLKEKERLTMENGVEATNSELAKILGIEEYDIVVALESLISPVSLFEPIYNDGGDTIYLFDQVEDKKSNCDVDMKVALEKAINKLSKKEQFILENRFFVGKTQMEIASEIGISQAQISRLEKGALKRIRKQL